MTKYIEINMDDWVGPPEYMQYEYPEDANHWEATLNRDIPTQQINERFLLRSGAQVEI